jgi:hypothetical protein
LEHAGTRRAIRRKVGHLGSTVCPCGAFVHTGGIRAAPTVRYCRLPKLA